MSGTETDGPAVREQSSAEKATSQGDWLDDAPDRAMRIRFGTALAISGGGVIVLVLGGAIAAGAQFTYVLLALFTAGAVVVAAGLLFRVRATSLYYLCHAGTEGSAAESRSPVVVVPVTGASPFHLRRVARVDMGLFEYGRFRDGVGGGRNIHRLVVPDELDSWKFRVEGSRRIVDISVRLVLDTGFNTEVWLRQLAKSGEILSFEREDMRRRKHRYTLVLPYSIQQSFMESVENQLRKDPAAYGGDGALDENAIEEATESVCQASLDHVCGERRAYDRFTFEVVEVNTTATGRRQREGQPRRTGQAAEHRQADSSADNRSAPAGGGSAGG